ALRGLVTSLAAIHGRRKALIYVTQEVGDVFDVVDAPRSTGPCGYEDRRAAMTEAMRGGVAIYPFYACGLTPGGVLGGSESGTPGESGVMADVSVCETKGDIDSMMNFRRMADATGGLAVVNSNGFDDALTRMVSDNSNYYALSFTSTNT